MMNYRIQIKKALALIEESDFWIKLQKDRAEIKPGTFVHATFDEEYCQKKAVLQRRLLTLDKGSGAIALALFYIVRDDNPKLITDATIDAEVAAVPVLNESDERCWDQLLGKFTCVDTLKIGLERLNDPIKL